MKPSDRIVDIAVTLRKEDKFMAPFASSSLTIKHFIQAIMLYLDEEAEKVKK